MTRIRGRALFPLLGLLLCAGPRLVWAAETEIPLQGEVPADGPDHFVLEFEVPPGTVEIEIAHADGSDDDILDWGLEGPDGFRGWGGGNSENAIVNADAASRSYLPGPITPGTWRVVVGKAKIVSDPATYDVLITLRDEVTLAPQDERTPYAPAELSDEARWYAGDFHVHSRESGDASATLDEIAGLGREQGLDFAVITDHNTVSHLDWLGDAQARHEDFLFVPGIEFTTYDGHAGAIGITEWVDHKIGLDGLAIADAVAQIQEGGALFSINHPELDLLGLCIGCKWDHGIEGLQVDAVEVATGGLDGAGGIFTPRAIEFWDGVCESGQHAAALGGSDDHKAGMDLGGFESPIGSPTTMVYATSLSPDAILEAIREGRTVVKLQGPDDPMIELDTSVARVGDTVAARTVELRATVTGAAPGDEVRFVENGQRLAAVEVDGEGFVHTVQAQAPTTGESRWRVEVLRDGEVRTITSHVWLVDAAPEEPSGCACTVPERPPADPVVALGLGLGLLLLLPGVRRVLRRGP